jgi:hypothetical protein
MRTRGLNISFNKLRDELAEVESSILMSTSEISKVLGFKTLYIMRVINGKRKIYKESIWSDARLKSCELLETPEEDNQQPS